MLLPIHVAAGGLAMVLGAVALLAPKGATVHRRSGLLFVVAMVTMGFSGSALALQNGPSDPNVTGGFLSAYFVITALTTVRPVAVWTRWVNGVALLVAVALALACFVRGVEAYGSPRGFLNGVPFFMLFFLGTVLTLAAAGDVRVMWSGRSAAVRAWRGTSGACASRSSSPPARSSRFARASPPSFRSHSPPR